MRLTGKRCRSEHDEPGSLFSRWLAGLLLPLLAGWVHAAVEVAVDRQQIAMGESFSLVISAENTEELRQLDLRVLERDFEILQRSQSSSTSILNGQRTRSEQLSLELAPRREGQLQLPSLGGAQPIHIEVGPPVQGSDRDDYVLFTAELDQDAVHVQQQVILTLRIEQAVNLEARSLSELQLENAFVVPLEQRSFQRKIDGRPWLVHEVRYAIFPERSGELQIPPQVFTARESQRRRSGINFGLGGAQLQRRSEALTLTVLPRPDDYPANATWLPARALELEQSWSADPAHLQVGDSLTRNITLRAEGLLGAQLPPVDFGAPSGLRFYADQPEISDREGAEGVIGERRDSAALVASDAGEWVLPAVEIAWWDTSTETLQVARLPEQRIVVETAAGRQVAGGGSAGAAPASRTSGDGSAGGPMGDGTVDRTTGDDSADEARDESPTGERAGANGGTPMKDAQSASGVLRWQGWVWLSALLAAGWLVTALLWWRQHRQRELMAGPLSAVSPPGTRSATHPHGAANPREEKRAFLQLQAACTSHAAGAARRALLNWGRARYGEPASSSLLDLETCCDDPPLRQAIQELERCMYAADAGGQWHGGNLLSAVQTLRGEPLGAEDADQAMPLYPR